MARASLGNCKTQTDIRALIIFEKKKNKTINLVKKLKIPIPLGMGILGYSSFWFSVSSFVFPSTKNALETILGRLAEILCKKSF